MMPFKDYWRELCQAGWTYLDTYDAKEKTPLDHSQRLEATMVAIVMQQMTANLGYDVVWNFTDLSVNDHHPDYHNISNYEKYGVLFYVRHEGQAYSLWSNYSSHFEDACILLMGTEFFSCTETKSHQYSQDVIKSAHDDFIQENKEAYEDAKKGLKQVLALHERHSLNEETASLATVRPTRRM